MAIPTTSDGNNFLEWRDNTNTVANSVGDLTTLTTTEKASLVGAVNEISAYFIGGWTGSTDIITLGTITTGTWNATAIADDKISSTLTGKTYNSLTLTSNAVGWTVGGGTTGVSVSFLGGAAYQFSGTNGQTYTLPASTGTLAKNDQSFYIGTTSIPINAGTGSVTNIAGLTSITATSFVGTASKANVWTTGRTITIGSTGKTVDGSAAVTWTLAEIGVPGLATGNTFTAKQIVNLASSAISTTSSIGQVECMNDGTGAAAITFNRLGEHRVNFGIDTDNILKVGGWTAGAAYKVWHDGNATNAANTWTAVQTFKHVNFSAEYDNGLVNGAVVINWSNGQQQKLTMTGSITAMTFNFTGVGPGFYQIKVIQSNTSAYTITWSTGTPAAAYWLNNPAAPSLFTGAAGRTTMFNFFWDGTICYGSGAKVDAY